MYVNVSKHLQLPRLWITAMQIACPGTQWNILVYFHRFGSSILHKCKKSLIGHMPNNKYSIPCVHQSIFTPLKKCQVLFWKWPAGGAWECFGGTAFFQLLIWLLWCAIFMAVTYYSYLILKNITEYKIAVTSNIYFSIVVQLLYKWDDWSV